MADVQVVVLPKAVESKEWLDLSLAQRAVWLDARLAESPALYQLGGWVTVRGDMDEGVARQASNLITARHDALRLRVDPELPRQWLDKAATAPFQIIDLSCEADPEGAFRTYVDESFAGGMPLGDGPLFRVELIRTGPRTRHFLLRCHHLLGDVASVHIILRHWIDACNALTTETAPELAPPSSYLPTVSADRDYLGSARYKEDLAYWTARFDSLPSPVFTRRLALEEHRAGSAGWMLQGEEYEEFAASIRASGVTAQRALFALLVMVLARRYGHSDLAVGMALHRRDASSRHVVGMLAGMIAVRCRIAFTDSLLDTVQQVSAQIDKDLRHQRMPVDALSRAVGIAGAGRAGLFEVAMSYVPADRGQGELCLDGVSITVGSVVTPEASPLSFHAAELSSGGGIAFNFSANPAFVDDAEVGRLKALFEQLVEQFVATPHLLVENLPAITVEERSLVVEEWNRTAADYPAGSCVDELFEAQASRTPNAPAVASNEESLSYAALNARANRLAHLLVARGVQPQQVVGVEMERSVSTVVALLAVLKAGGVYLPLDPAYPRERLDYMIADAGASLVIRDVSDAADRPTTNPSIATDARDLAYVIYTSGSTGQPKGVAVAHRAAVNLAFARHGHDPIGVGDRILAAISVGFDVSIGQLLLPLLSGATVVVAGDVRTMTAAEFWGFLERHRVSHINSVPSFVDSVLEAVPDELPLKRLMLGGEPLTGALVRRIQEALPDTEVVNMYGPTEACIDATCYAATGEEPDGVLPIGRPLSNYRAYILDARLEPVGIGVAGELVLGGAGLARGYVNQPGLTAERFIADPFGELVGEPGGRLYRTGDRARWSADGAIEFLGRGDTQVKVRGHRIELGEIEAQLRRQTGIREAVVVVREQTLAAYYTGDGEVSVEALRAALPGYMVPSALVKLERLPLTPNGKLDRKALPAPGEQAWEPPKGELEEALACIWAELLNLERVGRRDNFFELGGHSLLATRLVSQVQSVLGVSLTLRAVFEAQTVESLAWRIDVAGLAPKNPDAVLVARERPADLPLSHSQERLWLLDRIQQDERYNIAVALRLTGALDVRAAERAIERIVDRHEALRTRIVVDHGRPLQHIQPPGSFAVEFVNLRGDALREHLRELSARRFDLAADLPLKIEIIALHSDVHVLAAVVHHAAFDGWSAGIFFAEFASLYDAFSRGLPDPMRPLSLQYADFAVWQREQPMDADLAWWREELAGAPSQLGFPADCRPSGRLKSHGGVRALHFEPALHRALMACAQARHASLFMLLHTAFAILLARWSGQNDIVIGTVVANRTRRELEPVIGCFVNTLALRTQLRPGESVDRLLNRVRESDLAAYAHQALPFEELVEALQPDRSLNDTPIFQAMLVLQNVPFAQKEVAGLVVEPIPIEPGPAKFKLTLNLGESRDGAALEGSLEYAADVFEADTMVRFAEQYRRLLETMVANPELPALEIDILDAAERSLVVEEWNRTAADYPAGSCLDELFEAQAAWTPEAPAVASDEESLSYAALNARANRLAHLLVARGVQPQQVVGVEMERSVSTVVALLAVLKAGGVYLPLDPAYPRERLDYMIADAGASLVIRDVSDAADRPTTNPSIATDARDLGYVIYTSGSTGQPKGVAVAHRAAVNLAFARHGHDPIGVGDRILAAISVGFDVSIGQLLLPLLSGATVVVAGDVRTMTAAEFWGFLERHRVSHINSVPSFVDSVLEAVPDELPLKRLMLGGEPLTGALVRRIREALPDTEVVNMYGPTEACIDATCYAATGDEPDGVLPIGRPLSNYRAYILDARLEPVGIGVAGELVLGGAGLARGYVNQPGLTAERFIADPFGELVGEPGGRLYRTGDRARWSADGAIEFLGRGDTQVKVRGHRIELGEIEAQLRRQTGIREAVVVVREQTLVAYYTGDGEVSVEALRAALPGYMVPSALVKLERLPLTPNGKLDRKALPAPGERVSEPPQGEVEEALAAIWAEVLKLERVGRHDNFFELGGHSLLVVAVLERMRRQGLDADVRALFAAPTVAALADAVGTQSEPSFAAPPNGIPQGAAAITPEMLPLVQLTQEQIDSIVDRVPGGAGNVQDIYPLAPLQEGMLFHHLMAEKGDAYVSPLQMAFDRRDRLDGFLEALRELIQRHDILRTAVVWEGLTEPVQVVWRRATLPVEEAALDADDSRRFRMDVRQAPMLRAFIARDAERDRWQLLLLNHHLILDHASLEIAVREVRALTMGRGAGLPSPLPFRNFVAQARLGVKREEQEAFFRRMLGDVTEPTAPYGLLDVQGDGGGVAEGRLRLEAGVARRLRQRARNMGVSAASLFHLAWALVLARVSERRDVVFGSVLLGRMRGGEGAGQVLGMFINTLPIRIAVDEAGVEEGVRRTHHTLAELLRHEQAPLAVAQRASGVPAPAPLFSVLFNYRFSPEQNEPAEAWPGVEVLFAQERTNYPLAMAVDDLGEDFLLTALAQSPIEPARICRYMQTAVARLVEALEHTPETALQTVEVLDGEERSRVVGEWNRTAADYPAGSCLDELFEAQASRTPNAPAVASNEESLSYAALNARANRLAHLLVARGVQPQQVVGVEMERSVSTVVALLAVLKAGGVYLPLDPAYPRERLDYMIADAGASLVIRDVSDAADRPATNPSIATDARDLAYVIYTSGSTGQPKGVAVAHRAAVNLAFARHGHDPIGVGDRILAAISVGFDVSIGQLLLPLLSGATVVVAGDVRTMTAAEFWGFLKRHRVSHINSVPSFVDSVLEAVPDELPLKRLMLGGEPLTGALVRRIQEALPDTEVVNMYGPTEACIDATCYAATGDEPDGVLPIGRPLANYRAYILDARLEPVGIGVAGELVLGGAGLARGYVNQPGLTAERFIADPFGELVGEPGGRLYRTGDRARWSADGAIEFLGRGDTQVKVRGHRIELGEIEAQLRRQTGIREAVVVVREQTLAAYYTGDGEVSIEALRAALPGYMVPSALVKLERLPLTPNGKLDRKALPAPGERVSEPPQGEVEEALAAIWAEVLKLERVGRHDNFFELGGHSLLVVAVLERMRRQGLDADVRALFAAPTVAALADAVGTQSEPSFAAPPNGIPQGAAAITPEMLPLVQLTQEQIDSIVDRVPGGAGNVQDIYPLAPLQEGMLFHHLMAEKGDAYVSPLQMAFDRRDRLDGFLEALRELIQRHDILRTAVVWEGLTEPVQVVWRRATLPVEEAALDADDSRRFRMDVRQAPMLRAFIARDAERDRWQLLLLNHHLILDHASLEIAVREVRALTMGRGAGLPSPLPFRNFVAQARLGVRREEQEAFFRRMLGDVTEPTAPYGLLDVQGDGGGVAEGRLRLEAGVARRLRQRARNMGVSAASLFHLAWALVLARVSERRDVVFGSVLLGRMRGGEGAGQVLGMFINTLPIRIAVDEAGVEEGVRRTHHTLAELLRHEQAPLAVAQRASGVPAPAPLFSVLFNYRFSPEQNEPAEAWPGVEVLFAQERTNYPLAMAVDDLGGDFLLTALAQSPIEPARICRYMQTAVARLVEALEHTPETALQTVEVLDGEERSRVVEEWNRTAADYPAESCLDELFEAQASRTPNAPAVASNEESLSYAALNARANRLAHLLVARGVQPQQVVGVEMERSVSTVVALLAVLKAGGVYLPLDPAYPRERLDYMIADAGASLVIRDVSDAADRPTTNPSIAKDARDLAYVIYTSGSTGQPKGVAVAHRAAVNLAFARHGHDPIGVGDRILAAISVGFDVSIGQLLLPLLSGATVVVAGDVRTMTAAEFWGFLERHRVSHINSVPSFVDSVLEAVPDELPLKRLMLGGEPLTGALVRRIREALPDTEVVNMYGPTEACIDATCHPATGDEPEGVLPIGRPLSNYQAYILDARLEPVGIGVAGELVLGGAGLARGYVNQPGLTAERFIADPFGELVGEPGGRLYRTGDRARWSADGAIEFLGRGDTQVKVRGHRIELGEIEAQLRRQTGIREAVVVVREQTLVAYYTGDGEVSIEALRAALPGYMVPSALVKLERLPLTPNGKLDRKALPAPEEDSETSRSYQAPRNPTELALQQIWERLLGVHPIGMYDNFFDLGGHSLAAIRLITICNAELNAFLPVRVIFERPTITAMAAAIRCQVGTDDGARLIPLQSGGSKPILFCVHPAGGHVFCYLPLARSLGVDQPVFGLCAKGLEEDETPSLSIEEAASDYIDAIKTVQPAGPYRILGMSSGGLIAWEMAQQLHSSGEEVSFLALLDTTVPQEETARVFTESDLVNALARDFGCADLIDDLSAGLTVAKLTEKARAAGRLPDEFSADQAERIAAVFRNSVRLQVCYRPRYWPGPLLVLRAMRRILTDDRPPDWSPYASPNAVSIDIDCAHEELVSSPLAATIAAHISPRLT